MATGRRPRRTVKDELARAAAFRTELRRFLRRTEAVTAVAGLTPQRYDLLLTLHAAAATGRQVRITDLCEPLQLQQTAVTELVKRAVDAGLVERLHSAEDKRVWLIQLTPGGETRLKTAFEGLREDRSALRRAFADLDESFKAASD